MQSDAPDSPLFCMKTQATLQDILHLLHNLIRTGVIIKTDLADGAFTRVELSGREIEGFRKICAQLAVTW
ncbi:hypothetical protein D9D10_21890 [Raoultella ornithinolytica]|nr:hypothetical protein RORB6_01875 [Raoultella ornithinolytica B6]RLP15504.1 hypothetical protein D9D10_21890 [Raoultella ornithinolytica]